MADTLSYPQAVTYNRHIVLPQIDLEGQEALLNARVLIIGIGGLGCPAAQLLCGSGTGQLTLVDDDKVEASNLPRQLLFNRAQVGQFKVHAARDRLHELNPDCRINTVNTRLDDEALRQAVSEHDLVLDCTDNFATRQSINQACVTHRTPLVSGAAIRMDGQLAVFDLRQPDSACYACVYGDGTDGDLACSQAGIVGPVVGIVGTLQALAAMQVLLGNPMSATLRLFDGRTLSWREMRFHKDPACPVCSRR